MQEKLKARSNHKFLGDKNGSDKQVDGGLSVRYSNVNMIKAASHQAKSALRKIDSYFDVDSLEPEKLIKNMSDNRRAS